MSIITPVKKRFGQQATKRQTFLPIAFCLLPLALLLTGCRQDMHDNPRYEPYEDGGNRQVPNGTVARGSLQANTTYTIVNSKLPGNAAVPGAPAVAAPVAANAANTAAGTGGVTATDIPKGEDGFPFKITAEIIERGQERFNISCSPCHGRLGDGNGMIALRGFKHPPSYHDDRLRLAPASHFYDVITNGFGAMYNYAAEIAPEDRWKIAAYIRVLQLSQRAEFAQLPDALKAKLSTKGAGEAKPPTAAPAHGGTEPQGEAKAKAASSH